MPILNVTDTGTCYQVLQRLPIITGSLGACRAWLLGSASSAPRCSSVTLAPSSRPILSEAVRVRVFFSMLCFRRTRGRMRSVNATRVCQARTSWTPMGDAFFNLGRTCTIICTRFHEMVSVKNRWLSRGGVSPTQLVFGKMPRIPGDLPSDDHAGLMALHDALEDPLGTDQAATEFRRRMAWRCAKGRQATMAQASREAVQRAVKASTNPGSSTPVSGCLFSARSTGRPTTSSRSLGWARTGCCGQQQHRVRRDVNQTVAMFSRATLARTSGGGDGVPARLGSENV